jgi:hypothetical protein
LQNKTANSGLETFANLVFHGGGRAMLEMRLFSEQGLVHSLEQAGFTGIKINSKSFPEFGIEPFDLFSPHVSARKSHYSSVMA